MRAIEASERASDELILLMVMHQFQQEQQWRREQEPRVHPSTTLTGYRLELLGFCRFHSTSSEVLLFVVVLVVIVVGLVLVLLPLLFTILVVSWCCCLVACTLCLLAAAVSWFHIQQNTLSCRCTLWSRMLFATLSLEEQQSISFDWSCSCSASCSSSCSSVCSGCCCPGVRTLVSVNHCKNHDIVKDVVKDIVNNGTSWKTFWKTFWITHCAQLICERRSVY